MFGRTELGCGLIRSPKLKTEVEEAILLRDLNYNELQSKENIFG